MATIEVDENEYNELKRVGQIASLIGKDPEARVMLQKAVAKVAPDQAGPEIRIREENASFKDEIRQILDDDRKAREKDREEREAREREAGLTSTWSAGRTKLRDAGYNDDGVAAIEKLMEEKGIPDHEVAAAYFDRLNPPPEPVLSGNSNWNFFDKAGEDNSIKRLMEGDTEGWLANALPQALNEARGR